MRPNRRSVVYAASAVALAAGLVAAPAAPAFAAGPNTTYLVLAPQGKSTAAAAARVTAAGGTVVANYDQIGVLVVRSANSSFEAAIAGTGVEAVAATTGLASIRRPLRQPATRPASRCSTSNGT